MTKVLGYAGKIVALIMVGYHILSIVYPIQDPNLHLITHLAIGLALSYLSFLIIAKNKKWQIIFMGLAFIGIIATGSIYFNLN